MAALKCSWSGLFDRTGLEPIGFEPLLIALYNRIRQSFAKNSNEALRDRAPSAGLMRDAVDEDGSAPALMGKHVCLRRPSLHRPSLFRTGGLT
ncbi:MULTISPECIES: hypothetical protein [unclassified Mesorhizobium]|uniref:hypothetical protein n=1 Tax=unclassified Mesorhizobium TaxID=325217 RepID=UPI00333B4B77